jgi:Ser/Thr protein kinase RdoA (MazF antagonist)
MTTDKAILSRVMDEYKISRQATIQPFGSGLINHTWVVCDIDKIYILQRINEKVFKNPEVIAYNIELIAGHLNDNFPAYTFAFPLPARNGKTIFYAEEAGWFRMFTFIEGSHTIDVAETPEQAYEAASQFGKFTRLLHDIDVNKLNITIPDFHNLSLRYQQFLAAIKNAAAERKKQAALLVDELIGHSSIVSEYQKIKTNKQFVQRVTHHDTKISNVLFDKNGKGICVIDLDTVMPGYFISDAGDMMRTYLSPVSEEEKDFSKIKIREEFYEAIVKGYYNEMKEVLTPTEKNYFFYSGCFMIYMQALRFLTDFLNNDMYYGEKYPGHNFVRAGNQAVLLQRLLEKKSFLNSRLSYF